MSGWSQPPDGQPYDGPPSGPPEYGRQGPGLPSHGPPGYGAPSPQPRRSSTGLVIGLLAGGFVLVILVVSVVVLVTGPDYKKYTISTPPTAAGYPLDTSNDSTAALIASRQKSAVRAVGNARIDTMVSALYRDPAGTVYAPKGVVFVGGTGKIDDPETFLNGRRSTLTSSSGAADTDPGGAGKASCITTAMSATCMWATHTSFGVVTPTEPNSASETATIMRRMRRDVERER